MFFLSSHSGRNGNENKIKRQMFFYQHHFLLVATQGLILPAFEAFKVAKAKEDRKCTTHIEEVHVILFYHPKVVIWGGEVG